MSKLLVIDDGSGVRELFKYVFASAGGFICIFPKMIQTGKVLAKAEEFLRSRS